MRSNTFFEAAPLQICILASILLVHPQTTATSLKQAFFHVHVDGPYIHFYVILSAMATSPQQNKVTLKCIPPAEQPLNNGQRKMVYTKLHSFIMVPENIHTPHGWSMEIPRGWEVKR